MVRKVELAIKKENNKTCFSKRFLEHLQKEYQLYLLILPALIYYVVFHYIPMYGVQIAFRDYVPGQGFLSSEWVGLDNFIRFVKSYSFLPVLKNTLSISILQLLMGFPCGIILAVMLNELRFNKLKKTLQTISYAPHFISAVAMTGIILGFLSERGFINNIVSVFGAERTMFLSKPEYFSMIYVISQMWQNTGWASIIYIAALSAVDASLYEAAVVDGATKIQKIWYVDIPSIVPTMVIMLILRVGSIMSVGYEQILLLQNDLNLSASQIISTYVYQIGLISGDYSYSAAIGLFNSVVNLILLVSVNMLANKLGETGLW